MPASAPLVRLAAATWFDIVPFAPAEPAQKPPASGPMSSQRTLATAARRHPTSLVFAVEAGFSLW